MGRGALLRTGQRHEDKAAALDPACKLVEGGGRGPPKAASFYYYTVLFCLLCLVVC
jgi:hypothetical protein